ncbi:MAG: hypothetical protein AB1755_04435 [Candidatus Omnitrophota bacterium]
MKKGGVVKFKVKVVAVLFLLTTISIAYCQKIEIPDLVDRFKASTDIQQKTLKEQYRYETMDAKGQVENVVEWKKFDERTDKGQMYYKLITKPQKTSQSNTYTLLLYFKNIDEVKDMNEGQNIVAECVFLDIADDMDTVSVSLFADDFTKEDKIMFDTLSIGD